MFSWNLGSHKRITLYDAIASFQRFSSVVHGFQKSQKGKYDIKQIGEWEKCLDVSSGIANQF